ncbi:hypothetical protein [Burkholderia multivorans]|uniref:Uncharacterized protein n=1 Tax=Burkholderia multivorans CGD2 TaxID=513052 RepID=B9BX93_9BURK|nr:hypothetical protein [Burkholderia multivorans]EEE04603.1 conserved hypothetical protein [Burkholderia multivorans CGD2]EEE11143.1 conserved hypothetical protein [Burkholderia multivorans CGD2M]
MNDQQQSRADALTNHPQEVEECREALRGEGFVPVLPELQGCHATVSDPVIPAELHHDTAKLVRRFARALANKLLAAQRKYGYSDNWMRDDWADECRAELMRHIQKGDPRDVAAYCAFLWHHNELTASPVEQPAAAPIEEMIRFCPECGRLGDIPAGYEACCPDWSQARIVPKRFAELCAETFRLCVSQPFPKSSAAPADERAAFESLKGAWQSMPPFDVFCAGWQAGRAASANETGAPIGWAWISPTGHVSRFTADFDGKHDQLVQGWKVRPVAFCDSVANETGAEGELIERLKLLLSGDAAFCRTSVARSAIERAIAILSRAPAQAAEPVAWMVLAANTRQPCEVTLYKSETEALRQDCVVPLYAAPQPPAQADARGGLTDEQRSTLESLARTSTPYEQEVLRSILAAPQPHAQAAKRVDAKARMDWAESILKNLPETEPTYSIIKLLNDYDQDERDEILQSIRAYADCRATQALFTQYPAAQADAREGLADEASMPLLAAVEWCIENGNCGPRTRATLVAVRALLNGANHAE